MNRQQQEELYKNEKRIKQITNILATPKQNNMTPAKEEMLKTELEYLYLRNKQIYKYAIREIKQAGY